jgi:nucleoside-diphosphate-sugar epimerase
VSLSILFFTLLFIFSYDSSEDPNEIVGPAVGGTKSILKSIKEHGPTVKRVIITSSFASIVDLGKGFRPGYAYTEADYNPVSI